MQASGKLNKSMEFSRQSGLEICGRKLLVAYQTVIPPPTPCSRTAVQLGIERLCAPGTMGLLQARLSYPPCQRMSQEEFK